MDGAAPQGIHGRLEGSFFSSYFLKSFLIFSNARVRRLVRYELRWSITSKPLGTVLTDEEKWQSFSRKLIAILHTF